MKAEPCTEVRSPEYRSCLLLYTKPALPGRVKTRLIGSVLPGRKGRDTGPEGQGHTILYDDEHNTDLEGDARVAISAEQAALLHAAFLGDLGERLMDGEFHLQVAWALDSGEASFPEGLVTAAEHVRQRGDDLGARLYNGLAAAAERFGAVAAVGSDHPELEVETVEQAFAALAGGADAAFGPVEDGGYYLVALRPDAVCRELFEGISWSTSEVLAQSLERCRKLELEVAMLPPGHDVDVAEDLARLAARLRTNTGDCPRTRELLAEWGWLT